MLCGVAHSTRRHPLSTLSLPSHLTSPLPPAPASRQPSQMSKAGSGPTPSPGSRPDTQRQRSVSRGRKAAVKEPSPDTPGAGRQGRSMVTEPPPLPRLSGTPVRWPRAPALRWAARPGCCGQGTQISHGHWVLMSSTDTVKAPGSALRAATRAVSELPGPRWQGKGD